MGALLEVRNLVKRFGGLRAVSIDYLAVEKGTITGLIGPNGAGKTTLFNLITGFLKPDGGAIFFHGRRIDGLPPHRIFRLGLVRTFQVPRELRNMTVLENLMLVPSGQVGEAVWASWLFPWAVRRQEYLLRERALEVLDILGLRPLAYELAGNLSAGQKKLLELGRALMAKPTLVLLDEPGAGVNPTLMRHLVAVLEALRQEQGITFFVIEHDMDLVARLCHPVIVLSGGEKLAEGSLEEVRRDQRVLAAYLGGTAYGPS